MIAELSDKDFNQSCASTASSASMGSLSSMGSLDSIPSSPQSPFEDLQTVKTLYDAKFAVYLVFSPHNKQYYALKVFPWEKEQASIYFLREARFSKFRHPNVVAIHQFTIEHVAYYDENPMKVSYMIMEYAKYGDFFNALVKTKISLDETLVRTYFRQLIEGLEHLHSNGAAHLDIKLENLLIGEHYTMKLADFDLSYLIEDGPVKTRGTKNFRAPELLAKACKDPAAADIYSAGIILFLLQTRGNLPFLEEKPTKGVDMVELKEQNPALFWEKHCSLLGKASSYFSPEFRILFQAMTSVKAHRRPTIADIKACTWYNGPVYSKKEVVEHMKGQLGC